MYKYAAYFLSMYREYYNVLFMQKKLKEEYNCVN